MDIDKEQEDFEKCFRDWSLKSVGIVFTQDDMISKRGINGNYDSTKHVHDLWTGWKWKASRKENLSEEIEMTIEQQRAAFEAAIGRGKTYTERVQPASGDSIDTLQHLLEGKTVSMDVSTGDHDAGHRIYGKVYCVQEDSDDGYTVLAIEESRNFSHLPCGQGLQVR